MGNNWKKNNVTLLLLQRGNTYIWGLQKRVGRTGQILTTISCHDKLVFCRSRLRCITRSWTMMNTRDTFAQSAASRDSYQNGTITLRLVLPQPKTWGRILFLMGQFNAPKCKRKASLLKTKISTAFSFGQSKNTLFVTYYMT